MITQEANWAYYSTSLSKVVRSYSYQPSAYHPSGQLTSYTTLACYSKIPRNPRRNDSDFNSGNMIGHPKHVHKACQAGADIIIAQGGEGGGHTGDIATSVLIPACADVCKQYKSPMTGKPVTLVAAGGMNDGRSVAAALMLGASGVWIGTRFIVAKESKAPKVFKEQ
jgi:hypothetical protein